MTQQEAMNLVIDKPVIMTIIDQWSDPEKNIKAKVLSISAEHLDYYVQKVNNGELILFPIPKKKFKRVTSTMSPIEIGQYLQKVIKREIWKASPVNFYAALNNLEMTLNYN